MARLPDIHERFLGTAVGRLSEDARLVGVAAGGSYLTNNPKACLKRLTYPWHKGLKVPAQNEAYASPSRCGLKRSG